MRSHYHCKRNQTPPGRSATSPELSLFSTRVGICVRADQPLGLVAEYAEDAARSRLELARIDFDQIAGFIEAEALTELEQTSQIGAADLRDAIEAGVAPRVLGVRSVPEWQEFRLDRAIHIPLPKLPARLAGLPRGEPLAVIRGAGNRSSIAASLLLAHGFRHLQNVMGGIAAYRETERHARHPVDLVFHGECI